MDYRYLGDRTGLRVSELALGTARLGTGADTAPDEALKILRAYAEVGGNFIDTSNAYQEGRSEEIVGEFLAQEQRDNFVVATKFGRQTSRMGVARIGDHRKAMLAEVEASLRRLKTDRIDIYFVHLDDAVTPVEELMRGFEMLVATGKVIYLGFSNYPAWRISSAATLAELRGWTPLAVLQLQYNLLERTAEREHLPLARAHGLGLMGWSPLAGGSLGKPHGNGQLSPQPVSPVMGNESIFATLHEVAMEQGCESSTVAVAWVMRRGFIPVIGPRTQAHFATNLAASTIRLSDVQMQRLDEASKPVLGHPYDLLVQVRAGMGLPSEGIRLVV